MLNIEHNEIARAIDAGREPQRTTKPEEAAHGVYEMPHDYDPRPLGDLPFIILVGVSLALILGGITYLLGWFQR